MASRLVMAGVDLLTVMQLGGWKSLAMVRPYAHLSSSHRRDSTSGSWASPSSTVIRTCGNGSKRRVVDVVDVGEHAGAGGGS